MGAETDREKDCARASKAIEDLGDGRVGRVRWMLLRRHVKGCPDCGTHFERMSAVIEALSGLQRMNAPDELAALVMAQLARVLGNLRAFEQGEQHERRNLLIVAGAAVFGLLVAIAVTVFRSAIGKELRDRLAVAGHA